MNHVADLKDLQSQSLYAQSAKQKTLHRDSSKNVDPTKAIILSPLQDSLLYQPG